MIGSEDRQRGRLHYKWQAFIVTGIGAIMATLDSSIVNVSLPTLTHELHAPLTTVAWVMLSYLLTITALLLTVGRLSDMISRKSVYIAGFALFTVASGMCGLSPSIKFLIFSRVLQAIGASCLMANAPAVLTSAFPPSERGRALGMNGTIVATGLSIGPPLGGFLIALGGWRLIFFINLPIGIVAIWAANKFLKHEVRYQKQRFDFSGAAVLTVALLALMLAITQGPKWGWGSEIVHWLFGIAAVGLAAFLAIETRVLHPMLDLALFRIRMFAAANISALINYAAMFISGFLMPYYLMQGRGFSAEKTGLVMMFVPLVMSVTSPFAGGLSDRFGSRILSSLGLAISGLGLVALSRVDQNTHIASIIGRMALTGLGYGIFQPPNTSAILGSVPKDRLGIASGVVATMRNLGMVLGVALASAVFASRLTHYRTVFLGPDAGVHAFMSAFSDALLTGAVFCAIGLVASVWRGEQKLASVGD